VPRSTWSSQIAGDPRWALGIGALITMAVAVGPHHNQLLELIWNEPPFVIPNFYALLASFVSGLDSIRVVIRFTVALLVAVCIFAGLGSAWLIGRAGAREGIVMTLMIALAMLSIIPEPYPRGTVEVSVDPKDVQFFEHLAKSGNRGPILELPLLGKFRAFYAPQKILLAAYHKRRTSTCFGSFRAPSREELAKLISQLPKVKAVRSLRRLGFTTIVLDKRALEYTKNFQRRLRGNGGKALRLLHENTTLAAYRLQKKGKGNSSHGKAVPKRPQRL